MCYRRISVCFAFEIEKSTVNAKKWLVYTQIKKENAVHCVIIVLCLFSVLWVLLIMLDPSLACSLWMDVCWLFSLHAAVRKASLAVRHCWRFTSSLCDMTLALIFSQRTPWMPGCLSSRTGAAPLQLACFFAPLGTFTMSRFFLFLFKDDPWMKMWIFNPPHTRFWLKHGPVISTAIPPNARVYFPEPPLSLSGALFPNPFHSVKQAHGHVRLSSSEFEGKYWAGRKPLRAPLFDAVSLSMKQDWWNVMFGLSPTFGFAVWCWEKTLSKELSLSLSLTFFLSGYACIWLQLQ